MGTQMSMLVLKSVMSSGQKQPSVTGPASSRALWRPDGWPGPCALQGGGGHLRGSGVWEGGQHLHKAGAVAAVAGGGVGGATGPIHLVSRAGEGCVEGEANLRPCVPARSHSKAVLQAPGNC